MKDDKNYILISSWQDISYSIYLIYKKNFKNINLIFFDKNIFNFFKKKIKLNYQISCIYIDVPYINLSISFKNIIRIFFYFIQLLHFKKKIKKKFYFLDKTIFTFGNEIAFKNAIFLKFAKFKKIYSYDILQLKKNLLSEANISHTKLFNNFSINRLKFVWHFLFYNILSGSNYMFWYNGYLYRYFKKKNFKNEIYLSSKIFDNANFTTSIYSLVRKKRNKKLIIILIGDNSHDIKKLQRHLFYYFELLKKKKFIRLNIYFKFHPDLSEKDLVLLKKEINFFKSKYKVNKIANLKKDIPLELINLKPLYYIGYDSGAFKFLDPINFNIIIKSNKILHNSYRKIYYKLSNKIQVTTERSITKILPN